MTTPHNAHPSTHNPSPVPHLDLAPKRKKPLSLWNPLDYLTLLYWAFFFPQALRWYVEKFVKPEYQKQGERNLWQALLHYFAQWHLVIQAFICMFVIVFGMAWVLQVLDLSVESLVIVVSVGWVVLYDVISDLENFVGFGLESGATLKLLSTWVLLFTIASLLFYAWAVAEYYGIDLDLPSSLMGFVAIVSDLFDISELETALYIGGITIAVFLGMIGRVVFQLGVYFRARGITTGFVVNDEVSRKKFSVTFIVYVIVVSLVLSLVFGPVVGIVVGVVALLRYARLLEWILAWVFWKRRGFPPAGTQMAWLLLPGFQRRIEEWLALDWETGIYNIIQLLTYTQQFIPAFGAVCRVLARLPEEDLLGHVSALADLPFGKALLKYGSVSFHNELWREFLGNLILLSGRWGEEHFSTEPRLDIPARAACAGFWYWYEKEAEKAEEAFAVVQNTPHSVEIYTIAQAIVAGQQVASLQHIAIWYVEWDVLSPNAADGLRPGALRALRILGKVAAETRTARHALALLNRSTAIIRATATLTHFLETGADFCPEPEWPLIEEIAVKWRDIVSKAGGIIGEEVLRQPIHNPYEGASGLPVTGYTFVGRKDIISKIERYWAVPGALRPLIIYGHRRMGKSSILRNLGKGLPPGNLLVYLDMQNSGFVSHTGELLLDIAEAIHKRIGEFVNGESSIPNHQIPIPNPEDYATLGSARRALNFLLESLSPKMVEYRLTLAIDEYEKIQNGIDKGRIELDVLEYLRSRVQQYHWLGLILAGLHRLNDLGREYTFAFHGQAEPIHVGYLSYDDALDLIVLPHHPDFALEYAPELCAELYRLTHGQPFLLQRLCWELVERWNERFLAQGESTPRELILDDLSPILTSDFYAAADYYFSGLWNENITSDERTVLRVMAARESPWRREELADALPALELGMTFELLHRHDVVMEDTDGVRFASELLRLWIVQFSTD